MRRSSLLRGLLVLVLVLPAMAAQAACDYYASPTGSGNGLTVGTPFRIGDFWAVASPGKTLCLLDGTYQGSAQMLTPPSGLSGASGALITVRAVNDGAVFLDGQYTNRPFSFVRNSWWDIEGLNLGNSLGEAISLQLLSDHNILRRVCAWNANPPAPIGSGNNLHTMLVWNSADNLFEDLCLFGYGRNSYNDFGSGVHRNTMRRAWMRWDGWAPGNGALNPGPALQTAYGTGQDSLYENLILVWSASLQAPWGGSGANHAGMIFRDGPPGGSPGYTTNGLVIYGYDGAPLPVVDGFLLSRWVPHTFKDVFVDGRSQPAAGTAGILSDLQDAEGGFISGQSQLSLVDRVTVIRDVSQALGSIPASANHTNLNDCTSLAECPNFYTGTLSSTQGARACFRYQDGTLTSTPLWPWPMDNRIKAALALAGAAPLAGTAGTLYSAGTVTSEIVSRYGALPGACSGEAPATVGVYYMAPNGNDSNSCAAAQVLATPKRTFASVLPCLAGGSTLLLRGGTYADVLDTSVKPIAAGTWAAPTTIAAYQAESVILQNPGLAVPIIWLRNAATDHYLVFDKLHLDGASVAGGNGLVVAPGGHHVRFQAGEVHHTALSGIYLDTVTDVEILTTRVHDVAGGTGALAIVGTTNALHVQGNEVDTNQVSALVLDATSGVKTNTSLLANTIHNNSVAGKAGIELTGTGLAANNLVWSNTLGVVVKTGSSGIKVYNNTVTGNSTNGVQVNSGATGTLLTNNITFGNGAPLLDNGTGTIQTTNLSTDPLFVDAAAHNYQLQSTSDARDSGTTLSDVLTDYSGLLSRPQGSFYDIGAYEVLMGGGPPPGVPTNLQITNVVVGALDRVTLTWSFAPTYLFAGGYNLYRTTGCVGTPVKLNVSLVRASTLTYTDGTVPPGATYCWTVRAQNASGVESVDSNVVQYGGVKK